MFLRVSYEEKIWNFFFSPLNYLKSLKKGADPELICTKMHGSPSLLWTGCASQQPHAMINRRRRTLVDWPLLNYFNVLVFFLYLGPSAVRWLTGRGRTLPPTPLATCLKGTVYSFKRFHGTMPLFHFSAFFFHVIVVQKNDKFWRP